MPPGCARSHGKKGLTLLDKNVFLYTLGAAVTTRQALPPTGSHGLVANFPFTDGPGQSPINRGCSSGKRAFERVYS